jgi:Leucine-rich repeat (LRR) protein
MSSILLHIVIFLQAYKQNWFFVQVPTDAIQRLNVLESLELSHNKIRRIHRRAFNSSSSLQTLDLSNNRLSKLSKRAFVRLDAIQKIDLRHNRLITLDDTTFAGLRNNGRAVKVYIADNPWLCNCILG